MVKVENVNAQCYTFETVYFPRATLKNIDATYVLTMTDSDRQKTLHSRLACIKPSTICFIQHNKGYKACCKTVQTREKIVRSTEDINDAFFNAFVHAMKHEYVNVLILEDDFIVDAKRFKKRSVTIDDFVQHSHFHVINLGCPFQVGYPVTRHFDRSLLHYMAHACIYSRLYMRCFIKDYIAGNVLVNDLYWNKPSMGCYCLRRPVFFQNLPATENRSQWNNKLYDQVIRMLKLDKTHTLGYRVGFAAQICIQMLILLIGLSVVGCLVWAASRAVIALRKRHAVAQVQVDPLLDNRRI